MYVLGAYVGLIAEQLIRITKGRKERRREEVHQLYSL